MKRRFLSLFLAVALALALVPAALAEDTLDESEHITLHFIVNSHALTRPLEEIPMWQEIQEKHNVTIEWDQISSGFDEKKAVLLSDPESMPDVWLSGLGDADIFMNKEAFVDMTDLIKYAPHIQFMFEESPITVPLSTFPDGGMYSLPLVRAHMPDSVAVLMINKTWLDAVGMDVPTNLDELEQVLIAFRDNDVNGNGDPGDEIPLDFVNGGRSWFTIVALTGAWGVVDDLSGDLVTVNDGQVDFVWATEAYKNLVNYLHKLWDENLINVEVFTQDYNGMQARSSQGESAMVGVTSGWSISDRTGQFQDQYVIVDALKASADSDIAPLWPCNPARVKMDTNQFSISATCKYPERAIALIDDMFDGYYAIQNMYGYIPDCVSYDEATDTYVVLEPEDTTLDVSKWTNALVNSAPGYFPNAMYDKTTVPAEVSDRMEQEKAYIDNYPSEIFPIVRFDEETTEELLFISTDLYKLVDEKFANWVVNGGCDEEWDQYMSQLETIGLSRMREIYQAAYDEYISD